VDRETAYYLHFLVYSSFLHSQRQYSGGKIQMSR
jgi:hypothetical protein